MMVEYIEACRAGEIMDGQMKAMFIRGQEILLANVGNKMYAASNICPHMKGRLSKGTLKGTVVTCPRHASQFDLKDGHVVRWTNWSGIKLTISKTFKSPRPLKTYPVKVEGESVLVEI
jgi:3-phenylpropionate/trans-cinnamate dioxygenase ferredoxin subunit